MAAIAGLAAALVALIATASAPARTTAPGHPGRPHLPRDGGLGRSGLRQELQPVHRDGPASGQFVRGAFYEPLIISTDAGGGHVYPWLAKSWAWTNGNKTLTLNLQKA